MKCFKASLKSISPIFFGRNHHIEKLPKELFKDHEVRTWREKAHYTQEGNVLITPFMIKNTITNAARYLSIQIPGKGKQTYTKHFESGLNVFEGIILPDTRETITGLWLDCPSDGCRGGTKRVSKQFPRIEDWQGEAVLWLFDETITHDILKQVIIAAGMFIGFGSLRAGNRGIGGRFELVNLIEVEV